MTEHLNPWLQITTSGWSRLCQFTSTLAAQEAGGARLRVRLRGEEIHELVLAPQGGRAGSK